MPTVEQGLATQIANIERTSGRTMAEWRTAIRERGLSKHGEIVAWLKEDHGMSHGNANRVALEALKADTQPADDPLDAMYAGPKAALRPLHERVIELARSYGSDVELAPKKAWVSVRRTKQFATVGPASASNLEVCLNLDRQPTDRLEAPTQGMLPRRVRLASDDDLDAEFRGWLREAYDRS
jgi:hypothetical protein